MDRGRRCGDRPDEPERGDHDGGVRDHQSALEPAKQLRRDELSRVGLGPEEQRQQHEACGRNTPNSG